MVEHYLAKVGVASSSLVSRSSGTVFDEAACSTRAIESSSARPRLNRAAIALFGIIAISGVIGIAISRGQRASIVPPVPTAAVFPVPVQPTPVPSLPVPGAGFAVADDPARHNVVLFGGVNDDRDTWLWNGAKWTLAHPPNSPPGRFDASAAYDPQTRTVFLFGGSTPSPPASTTRGHGTDPTGTHWTVAPAARRSARAPTWPGTPRPTRCCS